MTRLPTPGADNGTWGTVLNDFLSVIHDTDGTLKNGIVGDNQVSSISQSKVTGLTASLAAKASDSQVVHLSGTETITGAKTFNAGVLLDKGNHVYDATAYPGVDKTGATDSAAGLQTAMDASPFGARWYLPPGIYRFDSQVTLNRGRSLVGSGFYHLRDGMAGFGDSNWSNDTFVGGTIIRSTVTSGAAIWVNAVGGNNFHVGNQLRDFIMIGPGSGTSSGVKFGNLSPLAVILRPVVSNIKVCNFSLGVEAQHINEGTIDIAIQGCTKAVSVVQDVNNVTWTNLNMQRCVDGLVFEGTDCVANAFITPICQNVSGTGLTIRGEDHAIVTPYFENTPTVIALVGALYCSLHNPTVQGASVSTMTIASGCNFNAFWGLKTGGSSFTITNSGFANSFHGLLTSLTDSGSNTWLFDLNNGIFKPPKYGSSTSTGPTMQFGSAFGWRFGGSGSQGWQGAGTPEGSITAPVGSVYFRTDGGAGTTLYVKESGSGTTGWVAK